MSITIVSERMPIISTELIGANAKLSICERWENLHAELKTRKLENLLFLILKNQYRKNDEVLDNSLKYYQHKNSSRIAQVSSES